ncbi:MAG: glycine cleavage system aminomethyltransferase GcvT [bacterium JZ-2024 1]
MSEPLLTPVAPLYRNEVARWTLFAGWNMPLWFSGAIAEHLSVRNRVGMFDVSHMGRILVSGENAGSFLDYLSPSAIASLPVGKAKYTVFLNPSGGVKDDLIIYRIEERCFVVVCNAVNRGKIIGWMEEWKPSGVEISDRTFEWGLIAVQGPQAVSFISAMLNRDYSSLPRFGVTPFSYDNYQGFLARTGYTGEDGMEVFLPSEAARKFWRDLREKGIVPCGLAARDTLRLEAALPLYGHEWTEEISPLQVGFEWLVSWGKDFIGKSALLKEKSAPLLRMLFALEVVNGGIARAGHAVRFQGEILGEVSSGSFAPFLKKSIALFFSRKPLETGEMVEVLIRQEPHPAKIVPRPFYKRGKGK